MNATEMMLNAPVMASPIAAVRASPVNKVANADDHPHRLHGEPQHEEHRGKHGPHDEEGTLGKRGEFFILKLDWACQPDANTIVGCQMQRSDGTPNAARGMRCRGEAVVIQLGLYRDETLEFHRARFLTADQRIPGQELRLTL